MLRHSFKSYHNSGAALLVRRPGRPIGKVDVIAYRHVPKASLLGSLRRLATASPGGKHEAQRASVAVRKPIPMA